MFQYFCVNTPSLCMKPAALWKFELLWIFEFIKFKYSHGKSFERYAAQVNLAKTLALKEQSWHVSCTQINKRQGTDTTPFLGPPPPVPNSKQHLCFSLYTLLFLPAFYCYFSSLAHTCFMQAITYQVSRTELAAHTEPVTGYSRTCTQYPALS